MPILKKCWRKLTTTNGTRAEQVRLLDGSQQQKNKGVEKLKAGIAKITQKKKPKLNLNSDLNARQWKDTDKIFRNFIDNFQYYDACVLLSKFEDEGCGDGSEYYHKIFQNMWEVIGKALAGDQDQSTRLQTIPQCIEWANETQCNKPLDWGPQGWTEELESQFVKDIKKQIPSFAQSTADTGNLKDHLENLKSKFSEIIDNTKRLLAELSSMYLKCLHVCLLSYLTSVAERKLGYEEQVLLYQWTQKEHAKLCKHLQGSADHMLFEKWFYENGKKIESLGQETIQIYLRNMLEEEIKWNSDPCADAQYYFGSIQEKLTSVCQAVKDISATLVTSLKSIFWEEFFQFLTRYEDFLKHKVDKAEGMTSGHGVEMGLRIVYNSQLLRDTLPSPGSLQSESQIRELLHQCENKGIDVILRILSPAMKSAFKKYFRKNKLDYVNVLMEYQGALRKQGLLNHKKLNTVIRHRITVLYIQSFFQQKCQNKAEAFVQGRSKLKEIFSEWVSDKDQLGVDPLKYMTQMLTAKDFESLQTTTAFFVNEHQDLRKEHMMAILRIKGDVSGKETQRLQNILSDRKVLVEEHKLEFFEDVDIKCFHLKYLLCCQCL